MTTTGTNLELLSSTDDDTDDGGGKLPPSENVLARHHQNLARQVEEVVLEGTSIPSLPVCGSLASCQGGSGCSPGSACAGVPASAGVPVRDAVLPAGEAVPPARVAVPAAPAALPAAARRALPAAPRRAVPAAGGTVAARRTGGTAAARRTVPPVARARLVAGRRVPAKKRATNYSMNETLNLLALISEHQPIDNSEWETVVEELSAMGHEGHEARTVQSVRRKFQELHRKKAPTGDPTCPPHILEAKEIHRRIGVRADVGNGDEEYDFVTN